MVGLSGSRELEIGWTRVFIRRLNPRHCDFQLSGVGIPVYCADIEGNLGCWIRMNSRTGGAEVV